MTTKSATVPVVAGCLRNAAAVGRWITGQGWGTVEHPVTVIAAGERWPGRSGLRPAVEDWLGAGAVVAALAEYGAGPLSPEAFAAKAGHGGMADIRSVVGDCASGRELANSGFAADVAIATEIDASSAVPVLVDGGFTNSVV